MRALVSSVRGLMLLGLVCVGPLLAPVLWTRTVLAQVQDAAQPNAAQTPAVTEQPAAPPVESTPALPLEVVTLDASLREKFGLDPQHVHGVFAGPVAIVGSAKVDPAALREAAWVIDQMLATAPVVQQRLRDKHTYIAVMATSEMTTDLPETRDLTPRGYWDRRARGVGNERWCSVGEENILGLPGDPYSTESILIHEFAHTVHIGALEQDPAYQARLIACYDRAKSNGLWADTYAISNPHEYFAELVQSWFDCNRANDGQHNDIDTREKLIDYQPEMAEFLRDVFGSTEWRYQPLSRRSAPYLGDWQPRDDQRFEWPREVLQRQAELYADDAAAKEFAGEFVALSLAPGDGSQLRSKESASQATLVVLNRTTEPFTLWWIDYNGELVRYDTVPAGEFGVQQSYAGHAWLVRTADANQAPLGTFVAERGVCRTVVQPPAAKAN